MSLEIHWFSGLLLDFDGTIIDSTEAIEKNWKQIGEDIGVDPNVILLTSHGRRSIDVFAELDPSKSNWDYVCQMEGRIPHLYGQSATEIPGGRDLLCSLDEMKIPHCIVTSGTSALVAGWLEILQLPQPNHLVVAEDVSKGKPNPTCYLKGQGKLSEFQSPDNKDFLVVEDAPAGISAGLAAGFKVVALTTTHTFEQVRNAGADWIIDDLRDLKVLGRDGNNRVRIGFDNLRFCKDKADIL